MSCSFLDCINCHLLSDKSLQAISLGCLHTLNYLNINQCSQITDKGLDALSNTCIYIKELYLANCPYISEKSLKNIIFHTLVTKIDLGYNTNISNDFILQMEQIHHSLNLSFQLDKAGL